MIENKLQEVLLLGEEGFELAKVLELGGGLHGEEAWVELENGNELSAPVANLWWRFDNKIWLNPKKPNALVPKVIAEFFSRS